MKRLDSRIRRTLFPEMRLTTSPSWMSSIISIALLVVFFDFVAVSSEALCAEYGQKGPGSSLLSRMERNSLQEILRTCQPLCRLDSTVHYVSRRYKRHSVSKSTASQSKSVSLRGSRWQWEDWINKSIVKGDIAHTCRKYDKIQDWAKERIMDLSFDPNVRIEDDIVVPILHTNDL